MYVRENLQSYIHPRCLPRHDKNLPDHNGPEAVRVWQQYAHDITDEGVRSQLVGVPDAAHTAAVLAGLASIMTALEDLHAAIPLCDVQHRRCRAGQCFER